MSLSLRQVLNRINLLIQEQWFGKTEGCMSPPFSVPWRDTQRLSRALFQHQQVFVRKAQSNRLTALGQPAIRIVEDVERNHRIFYPRGPARVAAWSRVPDHQRPSFRSPDLLRDRREYSACRQTTPRSACADSYRSPTRCPPARPALRSSPRCGRRSTTPPPDRA